MRRIVALLSIIAIVVGTALATLPGRWMGKGADSPSAVPMHEEADGALHAPAYND